MADSIRAAVKRENDRMYLRFVVGDTLNPWIELQSDPEDEEALRAEIQTALTQARTTHNVTTRAKGR